jgi:AcrR family transcriptional regulator
MDLEESLLNAVDHLLALRGYREMTIEDVAREVGVANAVMYLHFCSKENLVLSHIDRIVRRVIEGLERIGQSAASPADKIRQMLLLRVMTRFDSVSIIRKAVAIGKEAGRALLGSDSIAWTSKGGGISRAADLA